MPRFFPGAAGLFSTGEGHFPAWTVFFFESDVTFVLLFRYALIESPTSVSGNNRKNP